MNLDYRNRWNLSDLQAVFILRKGRGQCFHPFFLVIFEVMNNEEELVQ
jgi:hypothetical protein